MKQLTNEWFKAACDDLKVIEKIIDEDYLSHIVAFHAQQCIEKTFKAVLEEFEIEIPKIHKLQILYSLSSQHLNFLADDKKLKILDELYIDSRYPGDLGLLPKGKPTIEEAKGFYEFAKYIYEIVKGKMEISRRNAKNAGEES